MDLPYALKLLIAADEQPYGFIKLRGVRADYQVRIMAEVGLVEATLNDGRPGSFTSINRVTDLGKKFLRTFPARSISAPAPVSPEPYSADEWQPDPSPTLIDKWRVNFATGLPRPGQGAYS